MEEIQEIKLEDLVILPEIENRLVPLSPIEYEELKESIRQHGLLSPIVVWFHEGKPIVVDGHHRLKVIKELILENAAPPEIEITTIEFESLDEALAWVDRNQLGRRNISQVYRHYIIGRLLSTTSYTFSLQWSPRYIRDHKSFYRNMEIIKEANFKAYELLLQGVYSDAFDVLKASFDENSLKILADIIASRRYSSVKEAVKQLRRDFKATKELHRDEQQGIVYLHNPKGELYCGPLDTIFSRYIFRNSIPFIFLDVHLVPSIEFLKESIACVFYALKPTGSVFVACVPKEALHPFFAFLPLRTRFAAIIPCIGEDKWFLTVVCYKAKIPEIEWPHMITFKPGEDPIGIVLTRLLGINEQWTPVLDLTATPAHASCVINQMRRKYIGIAANSGVMSAITKVVIGEEE